MCHSFLGRIFHLQFSKKLIHARNTVSAHFLPEDVLAKLFSKKEEDVLAKSKALLDMVQHFLRPIHNMFDIMVQLYSHVWTQRSHPIYPMPQNTPIDIL